MSDPSLEHGHDFRSNRERDEVLSRGPANIRRVVARAGSPIVERNEKMLVNLST
jgi:hypothetical protein